MTSSPRRGRLHPAALAVVGLVAVAFVGCSDGAAVDGSPVATTSVDLPKSYRFVPEAVRIDAGDTVTWTNHDDFTHNVMFQGEAPLTMRPGETVTRTFPSAGTFDYQCSLHPRDMNGSVSVGG